MRLGPVDHADRISGLRILRVHGQNFLLPFLCVIQLLYLEIDSRNLFQAVDIVRILLQNILEDVDGLIGGLQILGGIQAGTTFCANAVAKYVLAMGRLGSS